MNPIWKTYFSASPAPLPEVVRLLFKDQRGG